MTNALPNTFPFKAQLLQQAKQGQGDHEGTQTATRMDEGEWGLIALENQGRYFGKDKDHLTKKYITVESKVWEYANVILLTVDARDVLACLPDSIIQQCQKNGVALIVVVCKTDTVLTQHLAKT
jgi:hypothetical protein